MRSLVVFVLAIATGCSAAAPSTTSVAIASPASLGAPNGFIEASWPKGYSSLGDLRADADAVIIGNVANVSFQGPDPQDAQLPLTRYSVTVERVLSGTAPANLTLQQTGGVIQGVRQVVAGDPLLATGQKYLMYLHFVATGPAAGVYYVLGGGQGRFEVRPDGSLRKVAQTPVDLTPGITVDDVVATGGE